MENAQIQRKAQLEEGLANAGLTLRMDSKLCYCYVNGQTGPEWDVNRVVHECSVMHWLYNFTSYQERCNFASSNESRINYFNNQVEFLRYMRKYIYPMIKEAIITENGGLPTTWPWLVQKTDDAVPVDQVDQVDHAGHAGQAEDGIRRELSEESH